MNSDLVSDTYMRLCSILFHRPCFLLDRMEPNDNYGSSWHQLMAWKYSQSYKSEDFCPVI
jgi:hypothetical protein